MWPRSKFASHLIGGQNANHVVIPKRPEVAALRAQNVQTLRDIETGRAVRAVQGMARALGHFAPNDGVLLLAIADLIQAVGDGHPDLARQMVKHVQVLTA